MPQLELTRGEYGLEGEIRLPAWEHWQIQEQARPIRVDFGLSLIHIYHPVQPAGGKSIRWKGIVALSMAAAGMISFVIAMLAGAFVMARKGE